MIEPTTFHFLRPLWLLALVPAAWLLWRLGRRDGPRQRWARLCDAHLLPHLWLERPGRPARLPLAWLGAGWLLAVVALAGPSWQQLPQTGYQARPARVLVLDLSPAMAATDLPPSRLVQARFKLHDLLDASREGETALLVFAAEPHLVTPLTSDVETIAAMLPALSPAIMPATGDQAAPALQMAGALLRQAGFPRGEIILLTEGIGDQASALGAAAQLADTGYRVSVLGIGTPAGAPVPNAEGGFGGISRLDEEALRELARQGGGDYHRISAGHDDIERLLDGYDRFRDAATPHPGRGPRRWVEHGVWLLLPLLVIAAAGYRRGWLGLLLPLMLLPPPSVAGGWLDLWLTPDQQGQRLLRRGDPAAAARRFSDARWRAAARHAAGDYEAAARLWRQLPGAEARYNQGNALARAGRYREAIAAYDAALALTPEHADAAANKALLEKLLREQPPRQRRPSTTATNRGGTSSGETRRPSTTGEGRSRRPGGETPSTDSPHTTGEAGARDRASALEDTSAQRPGAASEGRHHEPPRYDDDIALEQWLRQIPDDPSALLQRKFLLEHLTRRQRR